MVKSVKDCIDKIKRMSRLAAQTSETLDELHGIDRELGISFFDEKTRARLRETNIAEEMMKRFLETLDAETLHRIHALMYSGRDGHSPVDYRRNFANESKSEVIRTICEKRPSLDLYLSKGVENIQRLGLDVEKF